MRRVKQKLQKLTEASEASLCDEGDSLVELGTMMKSLEPITKPVEDLKGNMFQCVEDVDNLSMVDLLRVVSEIGESMSIYMYEGYHYHGSDYVTNSLAVAASQSD